jgi:hypothetical protein
VIPSGRSAGASFDKLNWAGAGLGIAVPGLELGFLIAYRPGWSLSSAGLLTNVVVGPALLPVGLFLHRERLSPVNIAGVVPCLTGIVLVDDKNTK